MFHHKVLLGWINDVSSQPRIGKRWPIIDVDEQLVRDYCELFPMLRDWGYTGITIWGLYVNHAWPVELWSCVTPERKRLIDRIIARAHDCGLRVYSGLGVYNWGFEEIIRAHPKTAKNEGRIAWGAHCADNGVAMCYHSDAAREWMRKVVDFVFASANIDGVGMQLLIRGGARAGNAGSSGTWSTMPPSTMNGRAIFSSAGRARRSPSAGGECPLTAMTTCRIYNR